ncbi:MAG: Holliday junction branch migration DNA helicase RuvB [Planctomycetota bacterium]|nr:Holliday junction branch migration DNA helicase RuvB [Planctomycetota bacterium]
MPKLNPHHRDEEDARFDVQLRPAVFDDFVGQKAIVEKLRIYIQAASARGEALDHILFTGLPGLGKTTLATLIAREMKVELHSTSGPIIERPGDLAGILTNLKRGDILFIDEIHRLSSAVEEYLYSAMEDYSISVVLGQGPHARTMRLDLPPFTLAGATTREGLLTEPLRARFGVIEKLDFYPPEDLGAILARSARILNVVLKPDAAREIAGRARGTPRVANRLLRRLRDVAQVRANNVISPKVALAGLAMLGVDSEGLGETDRKILEILSRNAGAPVGLKTLATAVCEAEETIEEVYEPFLLRLGLIQKTPRGRKISPDGRKHLKLPAPREDQGRLDFGD